MYTHHETEFEFSHLECFIYGTWPLEKKAVFNLELSAPDNQLVWQSVGEQVRKYELC